jgi:hypothetical protein
MWRTWRILLQTASVELSSRVTPRSGRKQTQIPSRWNKPKCSHVVRSYGKLHPQVICHSQWFVDLAQRLSPMRTGTATKGLRAPIG